MSLVPQLFVNVQATLTEAGLPTICKFGIREPAKQINRDPDGNRVLFVPGQDGKLGKFGPARKTPTGNPRNLVTLGEAFTVYVYGEDLADLNNELAQYKALMLLHEQVCRALYLSGGALLQWGEPELVLKDKERSRGMELKLPMAILSPVQDITYETVLASMETENVLVGGTNDAPHETPDGTDTHAAA